MTSASADFIRSRMKAEVPCGRGFFLADNVYRPVSVDEVHGVYKSHVKERAGYVREEWDCDDYAQQLAARVKREIRGAAFGEAWVWYEQHGEADGWKVLKAQALNLLSLLLHGLPRIDGVNVGGHAVCVFVDGGGGVWVVEPQTGEVKTWPVDWRAYLVKI